MTPVSLVEWATRWGVRPEAFAELRALLHGVASVQPADGASGQPEGHAQSLVRLEAARKGIYLWRNNVGALADETGRFVRYGLANDSAALNARFKSSDLVGLRPFVIQPHHVGYVFGQFTVREVKREGWTYSGTTREVAQQAFLSLVLANGGDAAFTTGPGTL